MVWSRVRPQHQSALRTIWSERSPSTISIPDQELSLRRVDLIRADSALSSIPGRLSSTTRRSLGRCSLQLCGAYYDQRGFAIRCSPATKQRSSNPASAAFVSCILIIYEQLPARTRRVGGIFIYHSTIAVPTTYHAGSPSQASACHRHHILLS